MNLLANTNLFYPSARDWMWDYCVYLGPFTDSKGYNYDLGVCIEENYLCAAIVYGNKPGNYLSGRLDSWTEPGISPYEVYEETRRRANELKIVPMLSNGSN